MRSLSEFSIPIRGLAMGEHNYEFTVQSDFFGHFEDSPIQQGSFEIGLTLVKRHSLMELYFEIDGFMNTDCDRCLAPIELPIFGDNRLLVKYTEEEVAMLEDEEEVIFIDPESSHLQIAPFIYEFVVLAIPAVKTYECELDDPAPCNEEMLEYLENAQTRPDENDAQSSVWDALKDL